MASLMKCWFCSIHLQWLVCQQLDFWLLVSTIRSQFSRDLLFRYRHTTQISNCFYKLYLDEIHFLLFSIADYYFPFARRWINSNCWESDAEQLISVAYRMIVPVGHSGRPNLIIASTINEGALSIKSLKYSKILNYL